MSLVRFSLVALTGLALWAHSAAAKSPAELCALANETTTTLSKLLPIEVDAVTQTTDIGTDCGRTRIQFTRAVELDLATMEKDFRDFLQKQDNEYACGDKALQQLIAAGWTVRFSYQFHGGEPVVVVAACQR